MCMMREHLHMGAVALIGPASLAWALALLLDVLDMVVVVADDSEVTDWIG